MQLSRLTLLLLLAIFALAGCRSATPEPSQQQPPAQRMKTLRPELEEIPPNSQVRVVSSQEAKPAQAGTRAQRSFARFAVDELPPLAPTFKHAGVKVVFDRRKSSDMHGSARIEASRPGTHIIRLYRVEGLQVQPPEQLAYSARLMTGGLHGAAYLRLQASVPQRKTGQAFGMIQAIQGNSFPDWTRSQTILALRPGEVATAAELQLVVEGAGTVWIDDVHLAAMPAPR